MAVSLISCFCEYTTWFERMVIAISLILGILSIVTVFLILTILATNESSINNDMPPPQEIYAILSVIGIFGIIMIFVGAIFIMKVQRRIAQQIRDNFIIGSIITMGIALISIAFPTDNKRKKKY